MRLKTKVIRISRGIEEFKNNIKDFNKIKEDDNSGTVEDWS